VQVNLGAGTASLKLANVALGDYTKVPNSLMHGASVPATASLEINWSGIINRKQLHDDANDWGGEFVETSSKITFTALSGGFTFTSAETNNQEFSIVGHERNGTYFHDARPLLS
jgi:hypothetical protein